LKSEVKQKFVAQSLKVDTGKVKRGRSQERGEEIRATLSSKNIFPASVCGG
jgi:hypothetical protein